MFIWTLMTVTALKIGESGRLSARVKVSSCVWTDQVKMTFIHLFWMLLWFNKRQRHYGYILLVRFCENRARIPPKPRLQLLGHSLGFVPLFSLDENVYGLFDQVHVQVQLRGLEPNQTKTVENILKKRRNAFDGILTHGFVLAQLCEARSHHFHHLQGPVSVQELYGQLCRLNKREAFRGTKRPGTFTNQ